LPEIDASASTRVVSWNDAAEMNESVESDAFVIPQDHRSLRKGGNYDARRRGEPLVPGRFYDVTFDLQPDDQIIPAGKRIGLMIFSSDRDFTLWPTPGTEVTIDLDRTSLHLPIVDGAAAARVIVGSSAPRASTRALQAPKGHRRQRLAAPQSL